MKGWRWLLAGVLALSGLAGLLAAWPGGDVRVVNRSGQSVRGLSLCLDATFPEARRCWPRGELAPGQTWRVFAPGDDGGVTLTFSGQEAESGAGAYVTRGLGARFVIGEGERVAVEVR